MQTDWAKVVELRMNEKKRKKPALLEKNLLKIENRKGRIIETLLRSTLYVYF